MENDERAARYSDLFGAEHSHVSDCAYCPICATIAVVRNTRPEVLEHLASAAREMISAASMLLEDAEGVLDAAAGPGAATKPREDKVRRIDIVQDGP